MWQICVELRKLTVHFVYYSISHHPINYQNNLIVAILKQRNNLQYTTPNLFYLRTNFFFLLEDIANGVSEDSNKGNNISSLSSRSTLFFMVDDEPEVNEILLPLPTSVAPVPEGNG